MHVVLVGPVPPPYQGMTVYTRMLLDELEALGVPVRWIDSSDHRGLSNMGRIDWDNVSGGLRTAGAIVGAWRLGSPRLLYLPIAQSRLPFVRDALHLALGRLGGMHLVIHLHGGDFPAFYNGEPRLIRRLIRRTLSACSAIVVLSPSLTAQFDGIAAGPAIRVVPNAVTPAVDADAIEDRYATIGERPLCVSFLAALTGPKGAVDFVRAIEALPADVRSRARFVVAGNPDDHFATDHAEVVSCAERLRTGGTDIVVEGVVQGARKTALFAETDVFVLPSHREGQPLVLLEALSAGCAVVSTTVGGIPETVTEGEDALLVAPGDVAGLGDALTRLIGDPLAAVALGRRGRARWERCYQPGAHGAAMLAVFEEALER